MFKSIRIACFALTALVLAAPAFAVGPIDGEVGLVWWQTDFDRSTDIEDVSIDAGAPGFRGELWFASKVGVRAETFSSDLGDLNEEDAEYLSADVMFRLFGVTDNNFLALGLGWSDMDFTESGVLPVLVETSGPRATLEARIGVASMVQIFGHYTLMPELDDYDNAAGDVFAELEGQEYQLGVAWKVAPFMDLRAGYRSQTLEFTRQMTTATDYSGEVDSTGFLLGLGFNF